MNVADKGSVRCGDDDERDSTAKDHYIKMASLAYSIQQSQVGLTKWGQPLRPVFRIIEPRSDKQTGGREDEDCRQLNAADDYSFAGSRMIYEKALRIP